MKGGKVVLIVLASLFLLLNNSLIMAELMPETSESLASISKGTISPEWFWEPTRYEVSVSYITREKLAFVYDNSKGATPVKVRRTVREVWENNVGCKGEFGMEDFAKAGVTVNISYKREETNEFEKVIEPGWISKLYNTMNNIKVTTVKKYVPVGFGSGYEYKGSGNYTDHSPATPGWKWVDYKP
ncbi:hypothetical protein Ferpe_0586 [Fervidobacterium pennivorans DSM 9078]|uniref:Uncharacterized protein n=1 Tax=Fervidobacterium pennivorans (strain DSM 9078 / Ven5) TaxID=771875 RepID=H9UB24_FERPD|nr:hypothetical protein [Fervidobacterium pennivorans]AFG34717.1 hypothetical protein Ferpe_0586 [Fervidobacterium pennivorans DSM 9078]